MSKNEGFTYAYGWNVYYEKLLGLWSIKDEGVLARNRAWLYGSMVFFFLWLPQMASLTILWGDLTAMVDCLATNMSFSIAILKIITLQIARQVISSILVGIEQDWVGVPTKEELQIMLKAAKSSRLISIISFTLTFVLILDFMILQWWLTATNSKDPNLDPRLTNEFLFVAYFPFKTTHRLDFLSIWIGQFFSTILGAMCYSAPDSLISLLVLHLCGQLKILRKSLKKLVNDTPVQGPELYWRKLAVLIDKHEHLNDLAFIIRETFSPVLLVQMLACSVIFCFQGYTLFTTVGDNDSPHTPILELAFSVMFAMHTVSHFFFYCYIGDILYAESSSFANDFYDAEWYNLSSREAKTFLLVCIRSKTPLEIKAGKFCTFNLELFNGVLKSSMGYFSMLVAMKERLVD